MLKNMILNIAYFWAFDYICRMRSCCLLIIAVCYSISLYAKQMIAEDYYNSSVKIAYLIEYQ